MKRILYALHLKGQPTPVARNIRQEIPPIATGAETFYSPPYIKKTPQWRGCLRLPLRVRGAEAGKENKRGDRACFGLGMMSIGDYSSCPMALYSFPLWLFGIQTCCEGKECDIPVDSYLVGGVARTEIQIAFVSRYILRVLDAINTFVLSFAVRSTY